MTSRRVAKEAVASIAMAGALAAGASIAAAATAAADPTLPWVPIVPGDPPPPGVPPPSSIMAPLAQNGSEPGIAGLPGVLPDLSSNSTSEYLLLQNPVPEAPGGAPGTPPHLNALNNQYLLPQNLKPAAPGQGELYEIAPGEENADIRAGDYVKRIWHGYQEGHWKGGFLGHTSMDQLGEPLPGTAPPPGTTVPVGLGQNLPDEAWAPPPPPPLPPGAILPPPPEG